VFREFQGILCKVQLKQWGKIFNSGGGGGARTASTCFGVTPSTNKRRGPGKRFARGEKTIGSF